MPGEAEADALQRQSHEGFLSKQSPKAGGGWQRRWFVLDGPAATLSYFKEKDARTLFDELDADGSGFLDSGEVEELCKQMGRKLGKKELAKAMAEIDADGNDEVSFSEFEAWWALNGGRAADKRKPAGVIELVRIADVRLVGKKILLQSGVDGQRDYSFEAESKEEAGEKSTSSAVAVGLPPPLYRESCNAHVACPRVRLYVACLSRNLASCSV
jgi:hypothetical protein